MSDGTVPGGRRLLADLWIAGDTVPAGSKSGFAMRKKDERGIWRVLIRRNSGGHESAMVTVSDNNSGRLQKRRKEVVEQVRAQIGDGYVMPAEKAPLAVEVTFYRARPVSHFGQGRNSGVLKASAPAFPAVVPDATKLWRALEDDLTSVLWHDDSRIVSQLVRKRYGDEAGAKLRLWELPSKVSEL